MSLGEQIAESRKRTGLTQQELATRTSYSRSRVANHETGGRAIVKEDWPSYCAGLNDAEFTLELHSLATGGIYTPYLNGPLVEHHPASLAFLIRQQIKEAKEHMEQINFSKPFSVLSDSEIDHIEATIDELLDVQAAAQTLVIDLCSRLDGLSFNGQVKRWIGSRTAMGMIARRNY
ncbi:helix-turn-helix domain-containing protein [Alkalihalobacillus pseudalcaliphilus]|uniref:helix-turn-helix domain-containing protein n=1 Tax=Alkalihalobacillus pseudalcaliphilus TaxID=79884 RepID=UPI00064D9E02|nr:helix-turn-helix domain-containing protein [Alkalihalobacillus pseudalcaliphilus]KMK77601.1 hypothetical protein AB990_03815 [Alkalihalobacillus pseudalcaliphilus]